METEQVLDMEPEKTLVEADKKSLLQKVWNPLKDCRNRFNTIAPKKLFVGAVLGIVAAITIVNCCRYAGNNYMTPIRHSEKLANQSVYDVEKAGLEAMNKIGTRRWKKIVKIMHNSDAYMDMLDETANYIKRNFELNQDTYGENYKIAFVKTEKTELTKYELRDFRRNLQKNLYNIEDLVDSAEKYTSEEWRKTADDLDLSKAETKQLVAEYAKLLEELGRLQVTEGYEVTLEYKITGEFVEDSKKQAATEASGQTDAADQPEEESEKQVVTVIVLKVNGRWVEYNSFKSAYSPFGWV